MAAVVAVAPKAVVVGGAPKVVVGAARQAAVAVVKGMVADGPVEQAIHPAEAAAMHLLVVAKSRFGAGLA